MLIIKEIEATEPCSIIICNDKKVYLKKENNIIQLTNNSYQCFEIAYALITAGRLLDSQL